MKTVFLSLIIVGISYYSLRSVFKSFKGESKCGGCSSAKTCKTKGKIK
ncbi:FeoB-associated Cys-rich membrane protein [Psychrilyobacter sp.]